MSDNREINHRYDEIGRKLIAEEPELAYIRNSDADIVYLSSDCRKRDGKKVIFAQCEKIQDKYRWDISCDFTITVFEPNVEDFTDEQLKILLFHELLHVGIDEKDGEEVYSTKPHDLEDFKVIIDRFGTEWNVS